ncbi:MAG: hypothetical protein AB1324_01645, partial [Candidatus Micrarchaeota archaeon]
DSPENAPGAEPPRAPEPITQDNIDRIEKETIANVSRAITVLESVMAQWDALKSQPEDLQGEMAKYRDFHDALTDWETRMLRAAGEGISFDERLDRLREFVNICYSHA